MNIIDIYKKIFHKEKLSFALTTRLHKCETPFLNEFLEYYKHLGIDFFYLVNTVPDDREAIEQELCSEHRMMVKLIDKRPEDDLKNCSDVVLPDIREKFLLHVDMDEFLYLDGMTLHEFIEREGLQGHNAELKECHFKWVMSPLCHDLYAPSIQEILKNKYFFPSISGKSLARTQDIKSIRDHNFILKGEKSRIKYNPLTSNCFVFHISSRGIYDIINKIQFGQFDDMKKSHNPAEEFFELFFDKKSEFLPARFILLSLQSRFQPHIMNISFDYPSLKNKTNTALLKEITLNRLKDSLNIEISETDLKDTILNKINRYEIPEELVDLYAAGSINFQLALKYFNGEKSLAELGTTRRSKRPDKVNHP